LVMVEETEVDKILAKHRTGLDTSTTFENKPTSEAGEVIATLLSKPQINFITNTTGEGRRCYVILDELEAIGIPVNEKSRLSQTHKEISTSLKGGRAEQITDVGKGLIKSRNQPGGLANLFQRQPEEPKAGGDKNGG